MTDTPKVVPAETKDAAISQDKKSEVAAPNATAAPAEKAEVAKK